MFDSLRWLCCGEELFLIQALKEYSAWFMLRNCHIRLQIKHCTLSLTSFRIPEEVFYIHNMHDMGTWSKQSRFCFCHTDYRLVIICSSFEEEKTPIISRLHVYRRQYGVSRDQTNYSTYLKGHFVDDQQPSYQQLRDLGCVSNLSASVVDHEKYTSIILFWV